MDYEEESLTTVLRDHYRKLNKLEKLFYITFIVATSIYSISFISFLIMTGFISRNYQFIFLYLNLPNLQ